MAKFKEFLRVVDKLQDKFEKKLKFNGSGRNRDEF